MKIKDVMTDRVVSVHPGTTLLEVAQLMQKHDVGAIPVCEGTNLVGIVTDRDIVVRNIAHGQDPRRSLARDVMTKTVKTITPETSLDQAAKIMSEDQIRRLPVVMNNQLVGMVALGDLATGGRYDVEVSTTLGEISRPSRPENL